MPQGVHRRVAAQLVFIATKLVFIATRRVVLAGLLAVFLAVFLAIFLAALFASPVASQQPTSAQRDAIRSACRSDYEAHCASVPPGGKPALMCLQDNIASLSQSCQQAVNAAGGGSAPADAAATPTPEPKAGVAVAVVPVPRAISPRQEIFLVRSACREDFRRSCGDVPPGGGRIIGCLRANEASLSPRCQSALAPLVQSR